MLRRAIVKRKYEGERRREWTERSKPGVEKERRYQRATRSDGLSPGTRSSLSGKLDGEKLYFEEKTGGEVRDSRDTDSGDGKRDPPVTLFQLSIGGSIVRHRGSLFIATKT